MHDTADAVQWVVGEQRPSDCRGSACARSWPNILLLPSTPSSPFSRDPPPRTPSSSSSSESPPPISVAGRRGDAHTAWVLWVVNCGQTVQEMQ